MWPLTKSRDHNIDCDSFTYDVPRFGPTAAAEDFIAATKSSLLLYSSTNKRTPMECQLPDEVLLASVVFQENPGSAGSDCNASLMTMGESQTRLKLTFTGCRKTGVLANTTYSCLETSTLTSTGDQLIITELTNSNSSSRYVASLYCWLFRKSASSLTAMSTFYLLNGTQCHQTTRVKERLYQYVAVFSVKISRTAKSGGIRPTRQNATTTIRVTPLTMSKKDVTRRPPSLRPPFFNVSTLLNTETSRNKMQIKLNAPPKPPAAESKESVDIVATNQPVVIVTSVTIFLAVIMLFFLCRCVS